MKNGAARIDLSSDSKPASTTRRALIASFAAACLPANRVARAATADRPLVLGTSTPGGGFTLYGEMLERVLERRAGRKVLRTRGTNGTVENLALLRAGTIDAALIQGTAASTLFDEGPASSLCILFAMYPSPGMLAVPASSSARTLEDLKGRRIVFGVRTSGLVTLARQVFAGIGLDIDRDFDARYVDQAAESPRMVLRGDAAGLWGAGEGWPGFTQLAESAVGARFIGPSSAQIEEIVATHPLLKPMEVAIGTYRGIDRPLPTVGSVNWIMTRRDLDEGLATTFVDAMVAAAGDLASALPQASFSTLANTIASAPDRTVLHRVVAARA